MTDADDDPGPRGAARPGDDAAARPGHPRVGSTRTTSTRPSGGPPGRAPRPPSHRAPAVGAVATALFGLLIALAAVQTSRNADVREASRDALIDRIDERQQEVASLQDRIGALRRAERPSLQSTSSRVQGQLADAHGAAADPPLSTGFVAVQGPGLRVTVADNPDGEPDGRVRATDLRLLVNGLWQAGAEAIAINGRRLTASQRDRELRHRGPGQPVAAHAAVRRLGDRRRRPGRVGCRPARPAWSSRRWPTSSGSWSTGTMRTRSSSRRRPTPSCGCATPDRGRGGPGNQEDLP